MNYYEQIKNKIIDNEIYSKVKDYSKERYKVNTYFEIGKLLSEAGSKYGENIIGEYSEKLMLEVGKKYNKRTLFRMKQFYNMFKDKKVSPMGTQLSWSHYRALLSIKNINAINYYIEQISKRNLSKRGLEEIIKSKEYERLPESTKKKLISKSETNITDYIKNPIVFKTNKQIYSEKALQQLILEDIPTFLEELGNGFTFIKNEYPIKIGNRYNYIDLLLFNIEYNCYFVVELKITELKKEHIGQTQIYMNYIDENIKNKNHNKTIGLIVCKENNEFIIKYSSDKRILVRKYSLSSC